MAMHTVETATAPTTPVSPIAAMHARYEATWEEYNRLDEAHTKLDKKDESGRRLDNRYQDGMKASSREADALQMAILYQVPTTWQEALMLQYHVHTAADPHRNMTEDEKFAVETGLDTIFDFMCDEIDHDEEVSMLQRSECLVSDRRRHRTGKIGA